MPFDNKIVINPIYNFILILESYIHTDHKQFLNEITIKC